MFALSDTRFFATSVWLVKEKLVRQVPLNSYLAPLLNGAIGIGNTFFKSLNKIGAGLSSIVNCLYGYMLPSLLIAGILAYLFL